MKKYLTGTLMSDGRFVPMGWSKDLEYAQEIAIKHEQLLCVLTIIEDHTSSNNSSS